MSGQLGNASLDKVSGMMAASIIRIRDKAIQDYMRTFSVTHDEAAAIVCPAIATAVDLFGAQIGAENTPK